MLKLSTVSIFLLLIFFLLVSPVLGAENGTIQVLWGDSKTGNTHSFVYLTNPNTSPIRLEAQAKEQALKLNRQPVSYTASTNTILPVTDSTGITTIIGNQKWVTIRCQFPDEVFRPDATKAYFDELMDNSFPGIGAYWQENSYRQININGSFTTNMFTLSKPKAEYMVGDIPLHYDLEQECTELANSSVDFNTIKGINLMFPENLGCCAWGGSAFIEQDGRNATLPVTWIPRWGWYEFTGVVSHEMGHGFGLGHSAGASGTTYDSPYDVMSNPYHCPVPNSKGGCHGEHLNAYNKHLLGWGKEVTVVPSQMKQIDISFTTEPSVLLPKRVIALSPDWNSYVTIEARKNQGFDLNKLPGEGVILHTVQTTRTDPSWLFSTNNDSYSPGAYLKLGETAEVAGVTIRVINKTTSGYRVFINNHSR